MRFSRIILSTFPLGIATAHVLALHPDRPLPCASHQVILSHRCRRILSSSTARKIFDTNRKGEKTMSIRRCFVGLAIVSAVVLGIVFLASVPQASAETLTFRLFNHVVKAEMVPISDVEGHVLSLVLREGGALYSNGEWAWMKGTQIRDLVKGAGTAEMYTTATFLDGSSFVVHNKGTMEATSSGVTSGIKWTGDIVYGTGRFEGISGTFTASTRMLPPEKGEAAGKSLDEGTVCYTLPGK